MDTISLPIRFVMGEFERIPFDSDPYYAFLLASAMQIEPNELPITPNFGCYRPEFVTEIIEGLAINAAQFVPEVEIEKANVRPVDDGQVDIEVFFRRNE